MFRLNQPVLVSDLIEALSEESGCFQITSPCGEKVQIRLCAGYFTIEYAHCSLEQKRDDLLWEIIKIGETRFN